MSATSSAPDSPRSSPQQESFSPSEVFRPKLGQSVRVRSAQMIASTLDADGTFEGMPFMPEIVATLNASGKNREVVFK